jgi:hypothetical protein
VKKEISLAAVVAVIAIVAVFAIGFLLLGTGREDNKSYVPLKHVLGGGVPPPPRPGASTQK